VRQALRQIYLSDAESNLQNALLESLSDELRPVDEKGRWKPSRCSFSRSFSCALCSVSLSTLRRRALMNQYYDQPGWRQRGPEDVAGVLVLFACAAVGFCWYVAVSRLHLRNAQCLEIFLNGAILFFGCGLIIAQLIGRRKKREENWPHPAIVVKTSKDARWFAMQPKRSNSARIQRPQGAMASGRICANEARCHRGRDWRGQVHIP